MENQGSSICFHRFLGLRIASLRMKICCLREEIFNLEKLGFQEIVNPLHSLFFSNHGSRSTGHQAKSPLPPNKPIIWNFNYCAWREFFCSFLWRFS
nr:uncharacterized protein LOC103416156 isoform X8 [Malus domestica]